MLNTKNSLIEESDLLELTDSELQSASGGHYPTYSYQFGPINQYAYTTGTYNGQNGAFGNSGGTNIQYGPAPSNYWSAIFYAG